MVNFKATAAWQRLGANTSEVTVSKTTVTKASRITRTLKNHNKDLRETDSGQYESEPGWKEDMSRGRYREMVSREDRSIKK